MQNSLFLIDHSSTPPFLLHFFHEFIFNTNCNFFLSLFLFFNSFFYRLSFAFTVAKQRPHKTVLPPPTCFSPLLSYFLRVILLLKFSLLTTLDYGFSVLDIENTPPLLDLKKKLLSFVKLFLVSPPSALITDYQENSYYALSHSLRTPRGLTSFDPLSHEQTFQFSFFVTSIFFSR